MERIVVVDAAVARLLVETLARAAVGAVLTPADRRMLSDHARDVDAAPDEPAPLTKRQHEIYHYLAEYIDAHGYAPSLGEVAHALGFSSLGSVHEQLKHLERKGWIRRRFNESRAIEVIHRPAAGATMRHAAETASESSL